MECRIPPESVNDPNAPALYLGESGGQGISGKTLLRWMKEPEFDTAYRNARRAAFSQSIARLQQMSGEESGKPGAQKDEKRGETVPDPAEQFFAEHQQAQKCRFEEEGV